MKFSEFLKKIAPVTNVTGVEKAAGIPARSLHKHLAFIDGKKGGQKLAWDHVPAIVRALCASYGCIEIEGWRLTCDPDGPAFFAEKAIDEAPNATTFDGVFVYTVKMYRDVYDDFDLFNDFFQKEDF